MKRYLPFVIIAAVLIAGILGASALFRSTQTTGGSAPFVATQPNTSPATGPTDASVATQPRIPANVSVTIEEFGDYQCPPCGVIHPELKKIERDYGSRI